MQRKLGRFELANHATIFLDEQLNIKSFTPAVAKLYNVMPGDVGRPLAHITHRAEAMPALPTTFCSRPPTAFSSCR